MAQGLPFLLPTSSGHCRQTVRLDVKSVADDGRFEGYASLFNRQDMGRDVILPGAFRDSLKTRGPAGVKMLYQHDPSQPIGMWDVIKEDARGLFVRGRLASGVRKAREVLALLRAGALDGLSIGFKAVKGRRDARSGVRRLAAVDLWEISIVTFPMQTEARIASKKSHLALLGDMPSERQLERWLTRDAGLTRTEARAVVAGGIPRLKALRDAGSEMSGDVELSLQLEAAARQIHQAAADNELR